MTRHPRRDARPPLRVERVANAHTAAQMRRQLHDWLLLDVPSSVVDDLVLMVTKRWPTPSNTPTPTTPAEPDPCGWRHTTPTAKC